MPIYEYECIPNKHRFEVIQKFDDPPITHCTECGEPVQRLISPPAIQFKGSGWYITDYARKADSSSESDAKPTADKPSTDTSKFSESKAEASAKPPVSSDKKDS